MRHTIRELLRRGRPERGPGGIVDGHLAAGPRSPSFVSSQAEDPARRMDPIAISGSSDEVLGKVRSVLEAWPRTHIVRQEGRYLHAECRSMGLGFVDDLEFLVHGDGDRLDFRSASRIGYSDLGANRKRMELLVRKILELETGASS